MKPLRFPVWNFGVKGAVMATGFVLDASPSHIAILDVQLQRGRVLAPDRLEVTSHRMPESKKGVAR